MLTFRPKLEQSKGHFVKINKSKLILFTLLLVAIGAFYISGASEYLDFHTIQSNLDRIKNYRELHPYRTLAIFMGAYVLITSLSIPGAIVLTLLAGAIFGVLAGTLFVSIASCTGAVIAFIMSRYFFKDFMLKHFRERFEKIDKKFHENGKSYLFTIRLIPVSPFVVVNVVMALTSIKLWTYTWITYLAMLPGTFIYVYAGRKISEIQSPAEILTWPIILILTLLGILPFLFKGLVTFCTSRTYRVQ